VWENALARIIDMSLGAIIAFICAYLILPSRVTVNLPKQIAKTIQTNRKYAENVLPSTAIDYNHENAASNFRNYMLEEKNMESTIKKVEDTFNDVEDDLLIYNDLRATNRKLAADLSAVATVMESNESLPDISHFKEQLINALNELALSVDKNVILPHAIVDKFNSDLEFDKSSETGNLSESLENYLNWLVSDIHYMQEVVEIAVKSGALNRYRNMT
jgi:hypothetical protein